MKRLTVALLCLLTTLSLAACNTGSGDSDTSADSDTTKTTTTTEEITTEDEEESETAPQEDEGNKIDITLNNIDAEKNAIAMEAYAVVLRNEMKLKYPSYKTEEFHEMYYDGLAYGLKDDPESQLTVDMDGDGIEEIIFSYSSKYVILHYEEGTVYGLTVSRTAMSIVYADGSFSWNVYDQRFGSESGISRLSFNDGFPVYKEICRTNGNEYYIDDKQVDSDQYHAYLDGMYEYKINFARFDLSLLDPNITKALQLASEYWGIKDGDFDSATGFRYRLYCTKNDGIEYEVALYYLANNSDYDLVKSISVNVVTEKLFGEQYNGK